MGNIWSCFRCDVSSRDEAWARCEAGEGDGPGEQRRDQAHSPLLKHSPQEIKKIFDINVMAHFWVREKYDTNVIFPSIF